MEHCLYNVDDFELVEEAGGVSRYSLNPVSLKCRGWMMVAQRG